MMSGVQLDKWAATHRWYWKDLANFVLSGVVQEVAQRGMLIYGRRSRLSMRLWIGA